MTPSHHLLLLQSSGRMKRANEIIKAHKVRDKSHFFYLLNFTFVELNSYFSKLHSGHDLSSILPQPIGVDVRQFFPSLKFIFPGTTLTPWQFTFSYSITISQEHAGCILPQPFADFITLDIQAEDWIYLILHTGPQYMQHESISCHPQDHSNIR